MEAGNVRGDVVNLLVLLRVIGHCHALLFDFIAEMPTLSGKFHRHSHHAREKKVCLVSESEALALTARCHTLRAKNSWR